MAQNIGEANINLSVNTSQMEREVSAALKRLESRGFNLGAGINARSFTQPLGRITGAANEFQKSLDASNARVIAFGASAGAIYNVQRAFTALIGSTIEVQKSLAEINVILGAGQKTLSQFSDQLFQIARNSGQAFSTVATAAGELARQGLSVEQTLKRTSDALILARLSGLDAASSVEALTASINSFNQSALDSTQIVNKLASVDAAFAVSSADLAEALKRVGSSAQDVGVSFDELLAIVASVNQTTARGGAVIGNSLKTIFTRVQRTDVLNQLEALGIAVRDLQGNTAPAIQILTGLAQKFDQLGDAQRSQVAELVGGVFQINVLKAALGDLSREYSVYGNALKIASGATNEAITRNEELNKTLAALLNRTLANLTKVGSEIGGLTLQPAIEKVLGGLNAALESFDVKGDSIGSKIGKGIFEGIGSFISGPGLALLIGVFGKIFLNLTRFATDAVKTLLGLNKNAQTQAQIQERINNILAQNPALVQNILNKQVSLLQVEKDILTVIQAQARARQQTTAIASTITRGLVSRGVTSEKGVITTRTKSKGFIPNYNANKEIMGAISGGYMPGEVRSMNIPNYGRVTYNTAEEVKRFPGLSQPGIMPPEDSDAGRNYKQKFKDKYGIDPYASKGFVPNFANSIQTLQRYPYIAVSTKDRQNLSKQFKAEEEATALRTYGKAAEKGNIINSRSIDRYGLIYPSFSQGSPARAVGISGGNKYGFMTYPFPGGNFDVNEELYENVRKNLIDVSSNYFKGLITKPKIIDTTRFKTNIASNLSRSAIESSLGQVFEAGIKSSISSLTLSEIANFDLNRSELGAIQQRFKLPYGGFGNTYLADLKNSLSPGNLNSVAGKIATASGEKLSAQDTLRGKKTQARLQEEFSKRGYIKLSGAEAEFARLGKFQNQGFIPNFSPLEKALKTEEMMGGRGVLDYKPGVGLYVRDGKTQPNFAAVMRDHPEGIQKATKNSKMMQEMASNGFVPNFAVGGFDPMTLYFLASSFTQGNQQQQADLKAAQKKLTEILNARGDIQAEILAEERRGRPDRRRLRDLRRTEAQLTEESINQRREIQNQMPVFARNRGGFVGGVGGVAGRFAGRYGSGIALAAPIVAGMASQFIGDDVSRSGRGTKAIVSGIGDIASYAFIGNTIAPGIGAGIGAGIGVISTAISATKEFTDIMPELQKQAETAQERLNNLSSATQLLTTSLETLSNAQTDSSLSAEQAAKLQQKATEDFASSVAKLDAVVPGAGKQIEELYRKVGNTAELRTKIAELQSEAQKSSQSILAGTRLVGTSRGLENLSGPGPLQRVAMISGSLDEEFFRNRNLKDLKPSQRLQLDADVSTGADTLKALFDSLTATDKRLTSSNVQGLIDAFNKGGINSVAEMGKGLVKTSAGAAYLEEIIKQIKPEFLEMFLIKYRDMLAGTERLAKATEEINKEIAMGRSTIGDIDQLRQAFQTGTLTPAAMNNVNYASIMGNLQRQGNESLAKDFETQFQNLGAEIGNTSNGMAKMEEFTKAAYEAGEDYRNGLITLTQASERLKINFDKIMFAETGGRMFSGDRAQARQDILNAELQQGNLSEGLDPFNSLLDRFGDNAQTTARKINESFANLAENMQTGFEDAFGAFLDGTKTAEDAFRDMALSISQQIIKEQFSIGMRSLLGGLTGGGGFGGTTNNSGGLLGGIFNLFAGGGKAKGGIIRKYSGGGYVDGGSGVRDDVPAMLTDGEYVLRKSAVNKYGLGALNMLNSGGMIKGYAGGGGVMDTAARTTSLPLGANLGLNRALYGITDIRNIRPQDIKSRTFAGFIDEMVKLGGKPWNQFSSQNTVARGFMTANPSASLKGNKLDGMYASLRPSLASAYGSAGTYSEGSRGDNILKRLPMFADDFGKAYWNWTHLRQVGLFSADPKNTFATGNFGIERNQIPTFNGKPINRPMLEYIAKKAPLEVPKVQGSWMEVLEAQGKDPMKALFSNKGGPLPKQITYSGNLGTQKGLEALSEQYGMNLDVDKARKIFGPKLDLPNDIAYTESLLPKNAKSFETLLGNSQGAVPVSQNKMLRSFLRFQKSAAKAGGIYGRAALGAGLRTGGRFLGLLGNLDLFDQAMYELGYLPGSGNNVMSRGGRIKGYATGGGVSSFLSNRYDFYGPGGDLLTGPYTPEAFKTSVNAPEELANIPALTGRFNISDLLSSRAITDEDNPMVALRNERFMGMQNYQQQVANFKTSYNEQYRQVEEARAEAQRQADEINSQRMAQYNAQVTQGFIGGLIGAGFSLFGGLSAAGKLGGLGNFFGGGTGGGFAPTTSGNFFQQLFGGQNGLNFFQNMLTKGVGLIGANAGMSGGAQGQTDQDYYDRLTKAVETGQLSGFKDPFALATTKGGLYSAQAQEAYRGFYPYTPASTVGGFAFNVGLGTPAGFQTRTQTPADMYGVMSTSPVPPISSSAIARGVLTTDQYRLQLMQDAYGLGNYAGYGSTATNPFGFAKGGLVKGYATGGQINQFVQRYYPYAMQAAQRLGTSPEAILSQLALESGYGTSKLSDSFNLGGLTAGKNYAGATVALPANRFDKSVGISGNRIYRAYSNEQEFFDDYVAFLSRERYKGTLGITDPGARAAALAKAGYVKGDPDYAAKIERIAARLQPIIAKNVTAGATMIADNEYNEFSRIIKNSPLLANRTTSTGQIYDTGVPLEVQAALSQIEGKGDISKNYKYTEIADMLFDADKNPLIQRDIAWIKQAEKEANATTAITPSSLYEEVGFGLKPMNPLQQTPKALERFSPFYGQLGGGNYFTPQNRLGFNRYLNYIGFGGGNLNQLSSFNFPMTPTAIRPYAFSSSPFGGYATTSGVGMASAASTYFSTGSRLGIAPSWASRATGGMIYGGTSYKDDVPAMLMGGEYVIRKDVVDRMGQPFFDRLNRGQVKGFAEGGPVGTGLPSVGGVDQTQGGDESKKQFADSLTKLLKSLDQLNRTVEDQTREMKDTADSKTTTKEDGTGTGVTNNITISVNVDQNGQSTDTQKDESQDGQNNETNDQEKFKKTLERSRVLAELLRQQTLKVITEEQRPGGVLYQGSKGRDLGR